MTPMEFNQDAAGKAAVPPVRGLTDAPEGGKTPVKRLRGVQTIGLRQRYAGWRLPQQHDEPKA